MSRAKLRDIFIYNEYDTIKETQEPDKSQFVEVRSWIILRHFMSLLKNTVSL